MAGGLLLVLGLAAYLRHLVNGGFSADDWAFASTNRFFDPEITRLGANARPAQGLYGFLVANIFGLSSRAWLAVALVVAIAGAWLIYLVLRRLGIPPAPSGLLAGLGLVCPFGDSATLWFNASPQRLSLACFAAGLLLAARGFRAARGWWSPWHLASLVCYAASILTVEVTAPLVMGSGFFYLAWARGRRLAVRWLADLVLSLGLLLGVTLNFTRKSVSSGVIPTHIKAILQQGADLASRAVVPVHSPLARVPLIVLVLLTGAAVSVYLRSAGRDRAALRQALLMIGGGAAFALAAWVVLVPGDLGYSPGAVGNGNRIDAVASWGLVILAYGGFTAAGLALFAGRRGGRAAANLVALAAAVAVGVGYGINLEQDIGARDRASAIQTAILSAVHRTWPSLPPGSTVYVSGYPGQTAYAIPVFNLPWDFRSALRLSYNDRSLNGQPVAVTVPTNQPTHLICQSDSVSLVTSSGQPIIGEDVSGAYGTAFFLNYQPRFSARVDNVYFCRGLAAALPPPPPPVP